jgi:hypothetical protein
MPRRALASPRVGARITRVRFSTKSNYLSHIRSSHIRLQSSVDHCQTGAASESLSTAVASLFVYLSICLLALSCLGVRAARCVVAQGVPVERGVADWEVTGSHTHAWEWQAVSFCI